MNITQNEVKVGKLEVQMEEINRRFGEFNQKLDDKFTALDKKIEQIFSRFDDLDNKYVSKETFRFYQIVLGLIGTTVMIYVLNIILPNLFNK